jgi:hypothetical protein
MGIDKLRPGEALKQIYVHMWIMGDEKATDSTVFLHSNKIAWLKFMFGL